MNKRAARDYLQSRLMRVFHLEQEVEELSRALKAIALLEPESNSQDSIKLARKVLNERAIDF